MTKMRPTFIIHLDCIVGLKYDKSMPYVFFRTKHILPARVDDGESDIKKAV